MKIQFLLILFSFSNSILSQNTLPDVEIQEVIIEAESRSYKIKTIELGYHNKLNIASFTDFIAENEEIALFIKKPKGDFFIKKIYGKFDKINPNSSILTVNLRLVDTNGFPGKTIFQRDFYPYDSLRKNMVVLDIQNQFIKFPKKGVFVSFSLPLIDSVSNKHHFYMSKRGKKKDTYIYKTGKWVKYSWSISKNIHPKFGLELISYSQ